MLDIILYKSKGEEFSTYTIELSEEFYKELAKSEFSKIGTSELTIIKLDGEEEEHNLIKLTEDNRRQLQDFCKDKIVKESKKMLSVLGHSPSKQEYQPAIYPLEKLHDLLTCVENKEYEYLERTT